MSEFKDSKPWQLCGLRPSGRTCRAVPPQRCLCSAAFRAALDGSSPSAGAACLRRCCWARCGLLGLLGLLGQLGGPSFTNAPTATLPQCNSCTLPTSWRRRRGGGIGRGPVCWSAAAFFLTAAGASAAAAPGLDCSGQQRRVHSHASWLAFCSFPLALGCCFRLGLCCRGRCFCTRKWLRRRVAPSLSQ
jgi:hypothetical protein